jgi:hypothetical protein
MFAVKGFEHAAAPVFVGGGRTMTCIREDAAAQDDG